MRDLGLKEASPSLLAVPGHALLLLPVICFLAKTERKKISLQNPDLDFA